MQLKNFKVFFNKRIIMNVILTIKNVDNNSLDFYIITNTNNRKNKAVKILNIKQNYCVINLKQFYFKKSLYDF